MYSNQAEIPGEKSSRKSTTSPVKINGRPSHGGGGNKNESIEEQLKAKQMEVEKLKKDLKIRRESEDQMKQVGPSHWIG